MGLAVAEGNETDELQQMQQSLSTEMAHDREVVVQRIEESLRAGNTLGVACTEAGIDRSTLWRWCKEDQDHSLRERLDVAMVVRNEMVEDRLFHKAWIEGDVRALIFWLSRRDPARWGEPDAGARIVNIVTNQQQVSTAELVNRLTPEQRERLLAALRTSGLLQEVGINGAPTDLDAAEMVTVTEECDAGVVAADHQG